MVLLTLQACIVIRLLNRGLPPIRAIVGAVLLLTKSAVTKVFGVTVEEACNRAANYYVYMPDVIFKCFAYLWEKGKC